MPDPTAVRSMFARIAGRYDFLNRTLSLGIDQRWRRSALRAAGEVDGRLVVDVCCGTGDLALGFARAGAMAVGLDFTPQMLGRAVHKGRRRGARQTLFINADALRLPLADACADVVCVAFGIRNVADRRLGLSEMRRVSKPGGMLLVLEFTTPESGLFAALYRLYFTRILPRVGRLVSGDADAYDYLPRTVLDWPRPEQLQRELEELGLERCGHRLLTGGIACLHWGSVP